MRRKPLAVIAAAVFAVSAPAALLAQDAADNGVTYTEEEEDNDFPWGLLGLLGLAGLIPRKRPDTVHVDNRTRP